jgi:hypothetical protein
MVCALVLLVDIMDGCIHTGKCNLAWSVHEDNVVFLEGFDSKEDGSVLDVQNDFDIQLQLCLLLKSVNDMVNWSEVGVDIELELEPLYQYYLIRQQLLWSAKGRVAHESAEPFYHYHYLLHLQRLPKTSVDHLSWVVVIN